MERIHKKIWRQRAKSNKIDKLFVYMNNYCNLKCSYCLYNNENNKSKLDINSFKKALNILIKNTKNPSITILGGEPLLNINELEKLIKISSFKNIPITVFTNGTLINNSYKKLVERYNLNTVISIDGNKASNDKVRKFKNSRKSVYKTIIKNLKKFDMIKSVSINIVVTPKNVNQLSNNIKHLYKLGFTSIGISFDYSDIWKLNNISKLKKELKKLFINYMKLLKNKKPYRFSNMYEIIEKAQNKEIPSCSNLILLSDGYLYPCDKIIFMDDSNKIKFRLKKDILSERQKFFDRMQKLGLQNKQGFCDIGLYLYLKYIKKLKNKDLIKRLKETLNIKDEIEKILLYYFKVLIRIPSFRKIHNI